MKKEKYHTTICDNIVIGNRTIASGANTIGDGVSIASGSLVIKSVRPGITVVGVPGRGLYDGHQPWLDHGILPNQVTEVLTPIIRQQEEIQEHLNKQSDIARLYQV